MEQIIITFAVVMALVMKQAHKAAKELRALPENAGKKYCELLSVTIKEAWAMARAGTLDGMEGQKWVSKAEQKKANRKPRKPRGPNKASKGKASRKDPNFTPRPADAPKPEEASVSTPEERLDAAMACVLAAALGSPDPEVTPAIVPVVELGQPVDPMTKMEGQIAAGDMEAALRTLRGEVEKACAAPAPVPAPVITEPAPAPVKKGMTKQHVIHEFIERAESLRHDACHGLEWYEADHPDESYDECVESYRHGLYFDEHEARLLAAMEDYEGEAYCPNYSGGVHDAVDMVRFWVHDPYVIGSLFKTSDLIFDDIEGDIHEYWAAFCDKISELDWNLYGAFADSMRRRPNIPAEYADMPAEQYQFSTEVRVGDPDNPSHKCYCTESQFADMLAYTACRDLQRYAGGNDVRVRYEGCLAQQLCEHLHVTTVPELFNNDHSWRMVKELQRLARYYMHGGFAGPNGKPDPKCIDLCSLKQFRFADDLNMQIVPASVSDLYADFVEYTCGNWDRIHERY